MHHLCMPVRCVLAELEFRAVLSVEAPRPISMSSAVSRPASTPFDSDTNHTRGGLCRTMRTLTVFRANGWTVEAMDPKLVSESPHARARAVSSESLAI